MPAPRSALLQHQVILNTRPAHQQAELQALLESDSARVISFPSITISNIEPSPFLLSLDSNIEHYDIVLFVSRNAVSAAFRFLNPARLPKDLQLGVIGAGTFKALIEEIGDTKNHIIRSSPYNSEGLLNSAELQQVLHKNILIFRGQQGRNLLGDELTRRGATVNHIEVYRRQTPDYAPDFYQQLCADNHITLAVFTSNEGMINCLTLVDPMSRALLLQTPWLLISERMRESAVNLGHNAAIVTALNASDVGIHQTIIEWASQAK